MQTNTLVTSLAASALLALSACSGKPAEPAPEPGTPPAAPAAPAAAPEAPAGPPELPAVPAGAKVWFVEPADGAKITGPATDGKVSVPVKMGAEGIAVKPAGTVEAGSGHHHILVDATPDAEGTVVGADAQHIHFGKAQTEATLSLAPGEHTLQLQFADGIHRSYGPKLSSTIKITVAEGPAAGAKEEPAAKTAEPAAPTKAKKASKH